MTITKNTTRAAAVLAAACAASLLLAGAPAHADSALGTYMRAGSTGSLGHNAAPGGQVSRSQVLNRAQAWVNQSVPYSTNGLEAPYSWWADDQTGGRYRQDCSGLVSMAWQLPESPNTGALPNYSTSIDKWDLKPGDILNSAEHVVIFAGWRDKSAGTFNYYQESSRRRPTNYNTDGDLNGAYLSSHAMSSYTAYRYKNIAEDTKTATPTTAGVYRPGESKFFVSDRSGGLSGWAGFGVQGDVPLSGDWNKDGKDTFGVYRPADQTFYLTNDNGSVAVARKLGNPGDVPV
ncbi:hypothetical protein ABZ924_08085, partial [Streptomyces sp. NPDC046876]